MRRGLRSARENVTDVRSRGASVDLSPADERKFLAGAPRDTRDWVVSQIGIWCAGHRAGLDVGSKYISSENYKDDHTLVGRTSEKNAKLLISATFTANVHCKPPKCKSRKHAWGDKAKAIKTGIKRALDGEEELRFKIKVSFPEGTFIVVLDPLVPSPFPPRARPPLSTAIPFCLLLPSFPLSRLPPQEFLMSSF